MSNGELHSPEHNHDYNRPLCSCSDFQLLVKIKVMLSCDV